MNSPMWLLPKANCKSACSQREANKYLLTQSTWMDHCLRTLDRVLLSYETSRPDWILLGCDTVSLGKQLLPFRRILVSSLFTIKQSKTFALKMETLGPCDTAWTPRHTSAFQINTTLGLSALVRLLNPWTIKNKVNYWKTQSVPRSKHTPSRL
jgi:hypothetical protein